MELKSGAIQGNFFSACLSGKFYYNIFIGTIAIIYLLLLAGCASEKTDDALLKKDQEALQESLDKEAVRSYKFGKICIRASVTENQAQPEVQAMNASMEKVMAALVKCQDTVPLSMMDYVMLYRDYRQVSKFIAGADEDAYATITEALQTAYDSTGVKRVLLSGKEKIEIQNTEHALLGAIAMLSKSLGNDIALYEASKTSPELIEPGELKCLFSFYRSFLFFQKKLLYLSEKDATMNIDWLNANPAATLPLTRALFQWNTFTDEQTVIAFHGLNSLFRGLDRMQMEREIDEKRALEDLDAFLKDMQKLGVNNELVWSVEAYLYIKREEHDKAIIALTKLQSSPLLSADDKEQITASIIYLQKREKGAKLNKVYDKYFLGKIVVSYTLTQLAKIDWQAMLEKQNVPHAKEMMHSLNGFTSFTEKFEIYQGPEAIDKTKKNVEEGGRRLLDKAKGLF